MFILFYLLVLLPEGSDYLTFSDTETVSGDEEVNQEQPEKQTSEEEMSDLLDQISIYSQLINSTVKSYDGSESNLQSFLSQIDLVNNFFYPRTPIDNTPKAEVKTRTIQDFIVSAVKARVTGYLSACFTPDDNTLESIKERIKKNVLRDTVYYENQLLTVTQAENQTTFDFIKLLEQHVFAVRLVYQISQGVNTQEPNFADRRAFTILKRNLMDRAKDTRVRQAMLLGNFKTIEDILTKVAEFPTTVQNTQQVNFMRGNQNYRINGNRRGGRR